MKFDPLGLGNGKSKKELDELRLKELNNGRLAMIAISGMVAQELVDGLNLIPSDVALKLAAVACKPWSRPAGAPDEAACAKAFETTLEAAVRVQ